MEDFYAFVRSAWVVWMMVLFLGIVAWVLWPSNRDRFRRAARIPLSDDERPAESATARAKPGSVSSPVSGSAPGSAGNDGA